MNTALNTFIIVWIGLIGVCIFVNNRLLWSLKMLLLLFVIFCTVKEKQKEQPKSDSPKIEYIYRKF